MKFGFFIVGLESLIPSRKNDKQEGVSPSFKRESIFWIEVGKIKPNPYQPRKEMARDSLKELAQSVREYGVLQPLIVTKLEKEVPTGTKVEYYLIAGERRLEAAKLANLSLVPTIIREASSQQKLEISIVENLQREDLNSLEKAMAFKQLCGEFNLNQSQVAQKVGKSRVWVTNLLRLLDLPDEIKQGLSEGKISEGHARAFLQSREPKTQLALYKQTLDRGLNVREIEEKARFAATASKVSSRVAALDPEILKIVEKIKEVLDFPDVKLQKAKEGLRLVLNLKSRKELEKLLSKLK